MFWSASDDLYNVDQIHAAEKERIDTAKDRCVPKSDLTLLEAAFRHVYVFNPSQLAFCTD